MQWFFIHVMLFIDNFNLVCLSFKKVCLFISIVLFYDYKFSKIRRQGNCVSFYFYSYFYDYKFSKIDTQRKCVSFYFYSSLF